MAATTTTLFGAMLRPVTGGAYITMSQKGVDEESFREITLNYHMCQCEGSWENDMRNIQDGNKK